MHASILAAAFAWLLLISNLHAQNLFECHAGSQRHFIFSAQESNIRRVGALQGWRFFLVNPQPHHEAVFELKAAPDESQKVFALHSVSTGAIAQAGFAPVRIEEGRFKLSFRLRPEGGGLVSIHLQALHADPGLSFSADPVPPKISRDLSFAAVVAQYTLEPAGGAWKDYGLYFQSTKPNEIAVLFSLGNTGSDCALYFDDIRVDHVPLDP